MVEAELNRLELHEALQVIDGDVSVSVIGEEGGDNAEIVVEPSEERFTTPLTQIVNNHQASESEQERGERERRGHFVNELLRLSDADLLRLKNKLHSL
jgi:hypothetical protein